MAETSRTPWTLYFHQIAEVVATRATCPRASVGAIIVAPDNRHIIATGYNGSPSGASHCIDVGCQIGFDEEGIEHCLRVIHAEENAILSAALLGIKLDGCFIYCTHPPCRRCQHAIDSVGMRWG